MEDTAIIDLYWARDEEAITRTDEKYGSMCRGIAVRTKIMAQDGWFQSLFFVVAVCAILLFGIWGPGYQDASFIYFQF